MDFRVTEAAIPVCESLADLLNELPVDGDFVLPEYCPDVAAVLKCTLTVAVQNRQLSADRLLADGTVHIRVLYLDEERRCVRCCEFSQPFSTSFSLPAVLPNAFMNLSAKTDYVNCRAVSPRRLDVHGAFTLKLQVTCSAQQTVLSAVEGDGVFTRRVPLCGTVPVTCAEKPFTLTEVLEAGDGKQPSEQILRAVTTPVVTDCKVLANKAIIKGSLLFEVLYVTDAVAGKTDKAAGDVPFSQILDVEGLNEEWVCDAQVSLISSDLQIGASQSGTSALISVNAKLVATLRGWREEHAEAVGDAYSARCPLITETQSLELPCLHDVRRDERSVRQTFELPSDTVREVIDAWCEVSGAGMSGTGDSAVLDGRLLWCMLVCDAGGELSYYERTENFTLSYEDGCRDTAPEISVCRTSHQINGAGKLELRADLSVVRHCMTKGHYTVLKSVTANEEAAYPPEKAALKICYASGGEPVWDIARRCRTSVEAIMEENHLTGDILPDDMMLLVPLC